MEVTSTPHRRPSPAAGPAGGVNSSTNSTPKGGKHYVKATSFRIRRMPKMWVSAYLAIRGREGTVDEMGECFFLGEVEDVEEDGTRESRVAPGSSIEVRGAA